MLSEENKDVRKMEWTNKEVGHISSPMTALSGFPTCAQIDVVNSLQLLTAKPVTYLVNLTEKDYIRKKNKWFVPPSHSDCVSCFRSGCRRSRPG